MRNSEFPGGFQVPTVSLHVHERIDPKSIIAACRTNGDRAKPGQPKPKTQRLLFEEPDENPPLRDALDFYKHPHGWTNRLVAGDSLLVMNSLLEKEGLAGKVQMIYVDPPYGIRDGSNFQPFVNSRDVKDGKDDDLTQEPEMIKAFRDTWELGIHSDLTYLRDRLGMSRELLHDSGSVFVQISDENVHFVRSLLDEVFGVKNFVSLITFKKTSGATTTTLPRVCDYLLLYAKDKSQLKFGKLYERQTPGEEGATEYKRVELEDGSLLPISKFKDGDSIKLPNGARVFATDSIVSKGGDDPDVDVEDEGETFTLSCRPNRHWKPGADGIKVLWSVGRLLRQVGLRIYKKGDDIGLWQVEVNGFDYYNPANGKVESGDTSKIAMWLLDTDYDGRSLYPRQVFFPMSGDKDGWSRLAKNMKAEIDDELIEVYRGTESLPFATGNHKRVAVMIVDDRGIESLKVLVIE